MPVREIDELGRETREPEVMTFGPRPFTRWLRWAVLLTVVALAAPLGRFALYEATKPPPDFTLAQLQGAYYGMVRNDGTNDLSTIDASKFVDPLVSIEPEVCAPLFQSTVANRFPSEAIDGVSTYWLNEGQTSISLFTLRYPSTAAAETAYAAVSDALQTCSGMEIRFGRKISGGVTEVVPVTLASGVTTQVAFMLDRGSSGRYAFHVMQLSNTVSWQYRYDFRSGPYQPLADQQLMDGLAAQLTFIRDTKSRGGEAGDRPTGRR